MKVSGISEAIKIGLSNLPTLDLWKDISIKRLFSNYRKLCVNTRDKDSDEDSDQSLDEDNSNAFDAFN